MQEEKWYFLQPELPPIPEQQMEVHNRIEPLRGFLHLWPTPWTFSFFLQWQSLSSWPSSTGLLELMCRCPLSPLKPATRHVDPPGSAEIPDPEGREKTPESSRQVRRGTVSGFWPLITSAWAGRRWHVSVHELWQKERWARRGVHYRRHSGCCAWHCHLPTRSGSWKLEAVCRWESWRLAACQGWHPTFSLRGRLHQHGVFWYCVFLCTVCPFIHILTAVVGSWNQSFL